jgi:hypothetical protein
VQRFGVGVVDATSGASALLFTTDTVRGGPLTRFPVAPIPVAVRWGSAGEIWFAMRQNPDAPPSARLHAVYAVDVATRRVRLVRDSVRGDAAEISRAGDYELVLRTPADDPAPPTWPDFRTLVRVDLATGREQTLVDGPRVRWARLTARDDRMLVAVNGAPDPQGVALEYRLLTPDGRAARRVADRRSCRPRSSCGARFRSTCGSADGARAA